MQHVQYSDLLLQYPYVIIAIYLWNIRNTWNIYLQYRGGEARGGERWNASTTSTSTSSRARAPPRQHRPWLGRASGDRYGRERAAQRTAEARSEGGWSVRRVGERSEERVAHVGRATGGSEERASEWRRVKEGRSSEWSEARGIPMGRTPMTKHYYLIW
jgi:hypothetical protein